MMARRMIYLVACLCMAAAAFGQRVTRSFDDVSMSEALKWLNERSGEYNISFLYNDLDDIGHRLVLDRRRHPEVIQLIIQETDIVFLTPLIEPLERLAHRHIMERPRHSLAKGSRGHAQACHEINHAPSHHSTTIVLPSMLTDTRSNMFRRSTTLDNSSPGCNSK